MQGWVSLHRKLLDNPIFLKPVLLQVFIYCLLKANHKECRAFWGNNEILVQKGQFVTGRFELSNALNAKPTTAYNRLKTLKKFGFIDTKSDNKNTLVTVLKYDVYQSDIGKDGQELRQQNDNKLTTNGQQIDTNNNDNNVNNDNNGISNSRFTPPTLDEVRSYCEERPTKINAETFIDFYTSKGWFVGKNKMKDWKAAVRTWERKEKGCNNNQKQGGDVYARNNRDDTKTTGKTAEFKLPDSFIPEEFRKFL